MDHSGTHSPSPSRIRRLLRVSAALLLLAVLYVAVVGIDMDVSPQGEAIAGKLSAALGRDVRFTGAMRLEISARPKLRIGGMQIANARAFGSGEFARLGEARLALSLWPLLWGQLHVDELAGSDAHLRLQARNDGSNNWTFRKEATPAPDEAPTGAGLASGQAIARLDIKRVSLQRLDVLYSGAEGGSHYFNLDSLVARIPSGQPISLTLNGRVEKTFPYKVEFTGGPLADLLAGDQPWPVDLSLSFLSSQLTLKGSISAGSGSLHFALATQNLNDVERLFQTRLPPVGHARLAGDVAFSPGRIALTNLGGNMGKTTLAGAFDVDYGGPRPRLRGQISLPVLDLRPFMTGQPDAEEVRAQSLAEIARDLANATFDLRALNDADAALELRVGKWLNVPGAVHDAVLQVKLDHGLLTMPIRATLADATVSGNARIDARKHPARFEAALRAHDSSIGGLAGLLLGMPQVKGRIGRFDLRVAARGNRGNELIDSLAVQLSVERAKLSYGNKEGARPVQFTLEKLLVELPAGKPLHGEANGTLVDNSFSMSLHGASLTEILHEADAPVEFNLQAGSANAQVHTLLRPPTADSGTDVRFSLNAPHSAEISSWLGLKPGADVPVSLTGTLQARQHGWNLSGFGFQLGRSRLSAEAQQFLEQNRPVVKLRLASDLIDADELKSLLPDSPAPAAATPSPAAMIDIPVLPHGISLADADISVRFANVATSSPFTVHDLRFDARIRDGMMNASPFAARVAGADFTGAIMLDLRTQEPRAELWLGADAMDIGSVLQRLDIARNVEARVDQLRVHLNLRSSRLGQLLAQSDVSVGFDGGSLTLRDLNTRAATHIALDSGELSSAPGSVVHLDLKGSLDKVPVQINIETATAADLLNPALPIPFKLNVATSGATFLLSGDVDRPFTRQDVELALEMHGSRFDNLNALAHASLPPWGPWSASGKFHMSPGGYEISSLLLRVGSSRLDGHGKLDTRASPPQLSVELASPTIQIDDFRLGHWSPQEAPAATRDAPRSSDDAGTGAQQLLSREVLRRQNAYLQVRVDQVLSGKDVLGNGRLEVRLQDGLAKIGPVIVDTPGGSAMLRLDYEPGAKDVALSFRAEARHFDYGVLARRIDKQSEMRGTFDLDADITARALNFSELLRYGKGYIHFALWPENLKSGLLDLWAVNVLTALLPAVDSSHESAVNCVIGQFDLKDGRLSHKRVLVDTTRMRVVGKGGADFTTQQIQFYMQPRAKTPQFLSFPLPIEVSGTFTDFSVGARPGDVLETAGQFITSVVWVPLQSLFARKLPADGNDVCKLL